MVLKHACMLEKYYMYICNINSREKVCMCYFKCLDLILANGGKDK